MLHVLLNTLRAPFARALMTARMNAHTRAASMHTTHSFSAVNSFWVAVSSCGLGIAAAFDAAIGFGFAAAGSGGKAEDHGSGGVRRDSRVAARPQMAVAELDMTEASERVSISFDVEALAVSALLPPLLE